jgi:predicted nucleic acid-binding protein
MSAERVFVDTNVLLYSLDSSDLAKQGQAKAWLDALWRGGSGSISWQVLHEFYVNGAKKLLYPEAGLQATVRAFSHWRPIETSLGLIERAWFWREKAQVPYWDGLILAAAERAGCVYLLSEDFQAGRQYGSVSVINPFTRAPESLR